MKSKIFALFDPIETLTQNNRIVQILDRNRLLVDGKRMFRVDHVLGPCSDTNDILRLCEEDIEQLMDGKHLTMIMYGQVTTVGIMFENRRYITLIKV